MGRLTVIADREVCIGSGMCVFAAPGAFDQDDEAKVVVRPDPTDDPDSVRAAVESCPTHALTLTDEGD
jgi:ferredoxin